jgi:hypothetical protein
MSSIINIRESLASRRSSKNINMKAVKVIATILIYGLMGRLSLIKPPLTKKSEIQNTKAILEILEPSAFPIANIVLF